MSVRSRSRRSASLALFAAEPRPAAAQVDGVQLLAAGPTSVRFSVDAPAPRLSPSLANPNWSAIALDGYVATGVPGEPAVPGAR